MSQGVFRYPSVGALWSGPGSISRLGEVLDVCGGRRALLIVTPSAGRDAALISRLKEWSGQRIVAVFDAVEPHTPYGVALAAAQAARDADADCVISLGGGSTIDTARLVSLCLGENILTEHALYPYRAQRSDQGPLFPAAAARTFPHIAIPTTLSSAEFGDGGALKNPTTGNKDLFAGPPMAAAAVILDSDAAVATPASAWVMTGMRTLDHAIETVVSDQSSLFSDSLSCAAITTLVRVLPATLKNPTDSALRGEAQLASWQSYFGVSNGTLGLSHAIGHQLGARLGLAHGLSSCITLPTVARFLAPRTGEKMRPILRACGIDDSGISTENLGIALADFLTAFISGLGYPLTLGETGIVMSDSDVTGIVDGIFEDFLVDGIPGGIPSRKEMTDLVASLA
ncbi:MAG: iron-containing alcohol dehydrogenase [Aurantimicrobium sp.]|nr:iron-containing alcohol dehydrogenase [Aurantimicrobium sp.]